MKIRAGLLIKKLDKQQDNSECGERADGGEECAGGEENKGWGRWWWWGREV